MLQIADSAMQKLGFLYCHVSNVLCDLAVKVYFIVKSFCIFLGGVVYVCHSFAYVAYFVFLRDVSIRTQRAAVASRRANNLATHLIASVYLFRSGLLKCVLRYR